MSLIELKNISFKPDGKEILKQVNLQVEAGDYMTIVGPSGSGKSTLLRIIAHLLNPTSGELYFSGKNYLDYDPLELRRQIAYVSQRPYLFGDKVKENLYYPYEIRKIQPSKERITELFENFKMDMEFLDQDVLKLSGGELQRLALMRSLVFPPVVLLLDEITSALDWENKELIKFLIEDYNKKGITILWITHDEEQSKSQANKRLSIIPGHGLEMEVIDE